MTTPKPKHRWYHLTPDRFFVGLLAVQVFLFLSERFQWFAFNEQKGWTVLIAVGLVCVAVLVMLLWGLVCLCFRRRFQFSFRSLLVFLVALSVPLGWLAIEMQKARRQRVAVTTIWELGGSVGYDYQPLHPLDNLFDFAGPEPPGPPPTIPAWLRKLLGDDFFCTVVRVFCKCTGYGDGDARHLKGMTKLEWLRLDRTQITDNGLAHLNGMTKLQELSLDDTQITDTGLVHLEGLSGLEILQLRDTHVTDNGLAHLKGMTKLQELNLDNTQITDNGLAHLEGLTKLQHLSLDGTQVTDAGLQHLKRLTNLERLLLHRTQVTDAGLEHLKRLTNLRWLYLDNTQVTDEGVKILRGKLPNCQIGDLDVMEPIYGEP